MTDNPTIQKETEGAIGIAELPITLITPEANIPKEVTAAGVSVTPTTVPIPQNVAKLGVKPIGANVPATAVTIPLPLTDDQITAGIKKSPTLSIRWLAEWCVRKLKQFHKVVMGGKVRA